MAATETRRSRLTIDIPPELRRRIKLAALNRDISVGQYVVSILERTVPTTEELSGREGGWIPTLDDIERLNQVRGLGTQGRRFTDDSTDLIEQGRAERTSDL